MQNTRFCFAPKRKYLEMISIFLIARMDQTKNPSAPAAVFTHIIILIFCRILIWDLLTNAVVRSALVCRRVFYKCTRQLFRPMPPIVLTSRLVVFVAAYRWLLW